MQLKETQIAAKTFSKHSTHAHAYAHVYQIAIAETRYSPSCPIFMHEFSL